MERRDDVHIGSYAGEGIHDVWHGDSISLMIDGDHSGGEYAFYPHIGSGVCCESDEEFKLANNSQAQQYPVGNPHTVVGQSTWGRIKAD